MRINDGSVSSAEAGLIACSQIMGSNVKSNLQWDIFENLSDSKEFLKWMNCIIIDYDKDSWVLAELLLKKLGALSFYSKDITWAEYIINNEAIDFIIVNPIFYSDWSNKILESYLEFLNLIREKEKHIQIFAYTADVMPWTIQTLKKLGFADIITKPMDFWKFNNSLKTHLRPDLLGDNPIDKDIKPSNED